MGWVEIRAQYLPAASSGKILLKNAVFQLKMADFLVKQAIFS
jgi:hypothetical protein